MERVLTDGDFYVTDVYRYEASFAPIPLYSGTLYWVGVTNEPAEQWGWAGKSDEYVVAYSNDSGESWTLTAGQPGLWLYVPEPSSVSLFISAALSLLCLRKWSGLI